MYGFYCSNLKTLAKSPLTKPSFSICPDCLDVSLKCSQSVLTIENLELTNTSQKWKDINSSGKGNKLQHRFISKAPGSSFVLWGRRLAWTRIHAWGACDPGFKSQRPHHNNTSSFDSILLAIFEYFDLPES